MISIEVQSGYDGNHYRIDTEDEDQAAKWLLAMALKFGPSQGGIYAPMTIQRCSRWEKS